MENKETKKAIKYLQYNNNIAYKSNFIDDFKPIGNELIIKMLEERIIESSKSGKVEIIYLIGKYRDTKKKRFFIKKNVNSRRR